MPEKNKYNSKHFAIFFCTFVVLAGYRSLRDIGHWPNFWPISIKNTPQVYVNASTIILETRKMINFNMRKYMFNYSGASKLEDLVMESGGTPLTSIVVSTWRSGSTFLGDLINSVSCSYYVYEPLRVFGTYKQIRGLPHASNAIKQVKNFIKCAFNNTYVIHYHKFTCEGKSLRPTNKKIVKRFNHEQTPDLCLDTDLHEKLCKLFPFQTIKLDRFRLPIAKKLLQETNSNVKIVLLVRDPRPVMQSRRNIHRFCSTKKVRVSDCADPGNLCADMVADYRSAVDLIHKYPSRFMVIRYEDFVLNLDTSIRQLWKFLKLEPTKSVQRFLKRHTNHRVRKVLPFSTYRVSKEIPFNWTKTMTNDDVNEIQKVCRKAMQLWGYRLAYNETIKQFDPLIPFLTIQDRMYFNDTLI